MSKPPRASVMPTAIPAAISGTIPGTNPAAENATETDIDVVLSLKAWHLQEFERAKVYIEKIYGASPPVENLMHLCLCKGALEIVQIFHSTLQEIAENEVLLDLEELDEERVLNL